MSQSQSETIGDHNLQVKSGAQSNFAGALVRWRAAGDPELGTISWAANKGTHIWALLEQMQLKENRLVLFGKKAGTNEVTLGAKARAPERQMCLVSCKELQNTCRVPLVKAPVFQVPQPLPPVCASQNTKGDSKIIVYKRIGGRFFLTCMSKVQMLLQSTPCTKAIGAITWLIWRACTKGSTRQNLMSMAGGAIGLVFLGGWSH
ncbi:hypothetical protein B0H17DRAFT_1139559 [Mycena rosella]|uniref:Uncharacterized protein n=1 Tax=Mycena rosella TaxID=1033263 RepID=A0AAD7D4D3_MYCRO|nr:hypothetical protein B0H17DRAFT_1139559 [Mycena rosella]